jgi:1-phosphatidylinositol-4-phosphate 5-kinase
MNNFNLSLMEGGKSNAFIYTTFDEKFVIKTITKSEKRVFLDMLFKYSERISGVSFLIRILGLFKLIPQNQHFIIMENILPKKENSLIFDLKGSLDNRKTLTIKGTPTGIVLKDQNFLESNLKVKLSKPQAEQVVKTLQDDFNFLQNQGLMDYSVLLGIYQIPPVIENRYMFKDGNQVYSIGVIDILQEYNFSKFSEEKLKKIYKKNSSVLSVAEPNSYFKRISNFLDMVITDE